MKVKEGSKALQITCDASPESLGLIAILKTSFVPGL